MSKCPFWQAIYKGESPLSLHLFTSVLTLLSNSCSTMSKCPFWQAINKGDVPSSLHLFTSVLTFLSNLIAHLSLHDHSYQEKLALMIDSHSQNSTLLQSCFVGDPNLTRWILKHTVDDLGNSYKGDVPSSLHLFTYVLISPCRV
jgi:hypothetical protein